MAKPLAPRLRLTHEDSSPRTYNADQEHPSGKTNGIHSIVPALSKSVTATAKPRNTIQGGNIRVSDDESSDA